MKFNKDTFLRDITERVQNAIDKGVIKRDESNPDSAKPLEGFVQYALLDYVKDRAFSIDVLKNISIDERKTFHEWEREFGEIKSIIDLALINLYLFLKSEQITVWSQYIHDNSQDGKPMLDMIHNLEDESSIEPEDNVDKMLNADKLSNDKESDEDLDVDNIFNIEKPTEEPKRRLKFIK